MRVVPVRVDAHIKSGDDIAAILAGSAHLRDGDVLVVAQKIVSKAEGRMVHLDTIIPSLLARGIAGQYDKDPRVVELVLREATDIVRMERGIIVTRIRGGHICANSGVDVSNVPDGCALLLPRDSDASASNIRRALQDAAGVRVGVIISDTAGRPFRNGQTDVCLGCSGVETLRKYDTDMLGRAMRVSEAAVADQLAGAAEIAMQKSLGCPAAVIRGAGASGEGRGADLIRLHGDMFG